MTRSLRQAQDRPFVLGLTGSIGMGKSTVAGMFEDFGVPVFDADREVRRMQGPGGSLLAPIEAEFPGTTDVAGVDREKLGTAVFGDPAALARLEADYLIDTGASLAETRAQVARLVEKLSA